MVLWRENKMGRVRVQDRVFNVGSTVYHVAALLAKLVCLNPIKALHAATDDNDDDDSDDSDDNAEDNNDAGQRIEK